MNTLIVFIFGIFFAFNCYALEVIPPIYIDSNIGNQYATSITANFSNKKIINNSEIKKTNPDNLTNLLQNKMGLQISDLYNDGSFVKYSLRGFGDNAASNSLILLDGLPLSNPDLGNIDINIIPLTQIDHIEIAPSSAGVLYGDQAVGGVINIISKKDVPKERNITAAKGSFASNQETINLSDELAYGFGYDLNAKHFFTDNFREHNKAQNNSANLLLSYNTSETNAYLRYFKIDQHLDFPGVLTAEQLQENFRGSVTNFTFSDQDFNIWHFNVKQKINENFWLQLKAANNAMSGIGIIPKDSQPINYTENRTGNILIPEISGIVEFWQHSFWPIFSVELQQAKYSYDYITYSTGSTNKNAAAIYGKIKTNIFSPKLFVDFGLRKAYANYNLNNDKILNPKPKNSAFVSDIELSYLQNSNINYFLKRAGSYRFPKTDEETYTLSGQPLQTQTGISYETGINFVKKVFSGMFEIYRLDLQNEISTIPGANNFPTNTNLDPTKRIGGILDLGWMINSNLQLNGSVNLVKAHFSALDEADKRIPFVAEDAFNFSLFYKINEEWNISFASVYTGNMYPINDVNNCTQLLGGYTIYNANLGFENKRIIFGWRFNNIFNKKYFNYVTADLSQTGNPLFYYPAAGFNTIITLTLKF